MLPPLSDEQVNLLQSILQAARQDTRFAGKRLPIDELNVRYPIASARVALSVCVTESSCSILTTSCDCLSCRGCF
mgnify:CR=1 FL=1